MRLLIGLLGALLLMPALESGGEAAPARLVPATQGRGRHVKKGGHKRHLRAKRKKRARTRRAARRISHEL